MTFPHTFRRWRPHPWHGLQVGRAPPRLVHAYIEITPFDLVKYEIDKVTGYLRVDRPQRTSSQPPAGTTKPTAWASEHAVTLGKRYANELARRRNQQAAYEKL